MSEIRCESYADFLKNEHDNYARKVLEYTADYEKLTQVEHDIIELLSQVHEAKLNAKKALRNHMRFELLIDNELEDFSID